MLDPDQLARYRTNGHLTVPAVFSAPRMDAAIADVEEWANEFLDTITEQERAWYLDRGVGDGAVLRKLDNPHFHRPFFRDLAFDTTLVGIVEKVLGSGVSVYFSQIFFKPPGGGGPKPVHQDNYYFGPNSTEGVVTAWIALDDATLENGCLYYGPGTNQGPVYDHIAPPDAPFDLQLPTERADRQPMAPAPVAKGGVSLHHGNTFHRSADNNSTRWRRACALHYVDATTSFVTPALPYDDSLVVRVT